MKKLLMVLSAVATFCLLIPGFTLADPTHPNEIGIFTTPDGFGETGTNVVGTPVDVFLVLTIPTNHETGEPFTTIRAFECQLNFSSANDIFLLADALPPAALNIGDTTHLADGYLEYIVGLGEDYPVVNEAAVLIEFTFLNNNTSEIGVTLGPVSAASLPGELVFVSYDSGPPHALTPMYPVSGSQDDPVFIFNGMAVTVENESFGSIKALFR